MQFMTIFRFFRWRNIRHNSKQIFILKLLVYDSSNGRNNILFSRRTVSNTWNTKSNTEQSSVLSVRQKCPPITLGHSTWERNLGLRVGSDIRPRNHCMTATSHVNGEFDYIFDHVNGEAEYIFGSVFSRSYVSL